MSPASNTTLFFSIALLWASCDEAPRRDPAPVAVAQSASESRPATAARLAWDDARVETDAPSPVPDPFADWQTYRHAAGTELRHPPDWKVTQTAAGIVLVPPGRDPDGEMVLGSAGPAGGLTDPMSPAAGLRLDQVAMQTMPILRRSSAPRAIETGEGVAAAVYDYAGRAPDGSEVQARTWVTIAHGVMGGISLIARAELFAKRAPTVERIFTTLRDGRGVANADGEKAVVDARLVGRFQGEATSSNVGGIYVNTQLVWAFNADGTVLHGAQSHMTASERNYEGHLKWTATGSSDGSVSAGRWTARDGILDLRWSDGTTARFAYGFEPDGSLVVRHPVTRKLINFYSRVR